MTSFSTRKSIRMTMLVVYSLIFLCGNGLHAIPGLGHHHNVPVEEAQASQPQCCHHHHHHLGDEHSHSSDHSDSDSKSSHFDSHDSCSICKLLEQNRMAVAEVQWVIAEGNVERTDSPDFCSPYSRLLLGFLVRGPPAFV